MTKTSITWHVRRRIQQSWEDQYIDMTIHRRTSDRASIWNQRSTISAEYEIEDNKQCVSQNIYVPGMVKN